MIKFRDFESEDPDWDFAGEDSLIGDATKMLNKWIKPKVRIISIETIYDHSISAADTPKIRVWFTND